MPKVTGLVIHRKRATLIYKVALNSTHAARVVGEIPLTLIAPTFAIP